MLVDGGQFLSSERSCDVVIAGGGAAGLTLAHALMGKGLDVVVLEGGGERRSRQMQDPYRGEVVEGSSFHPVIDRYRERAIGGTSRIWGGRVIPFDRIDFVKRPWVPGSGWPFPLDELAPYYAAGVVEAEAGLPRFDIAEALPQAPEKFVKGLDSGLIDTTIERFSKPTNFWKRYESSLRRASDVTVVLGATVTAIKLGTDGRSVQSLQVTTNNGATRSVKGRSYIIAMGGLETTRLLLASNELHPMGVGNSSGQVGRNYMCHLGTTAGIITFTGPPDDVAHDYERDGDGIYLRRRLWINEAAQQRFQTLNTTFRTYLPDPSNPDHGDAILSAMYLVKNLVLYEYSSKFAEGPVSFRAHGRHVRNILRHPWRLGKFGLNWMKNRTFADRKIPSVVLGSPQNRFALEFHAEQAPNSTNRVSLSDARDRFGMPRLKVEWRPSDLDIQSIKTCYRILRDELVRAGKGTLEYNEDELEDRSHRYGVVGGHHIGTTRMSNDPKLGVVNSDCRVHDVENLYVASSSVFPTSSQANPTLTILALALRLADNLLQQHRGQFTKAAS